MQIEGLAAVVVGGASGLGAATARALAAAGARVTILDRDPAAAATVAMSLRDSPSLMTYSMSSWARISLRMYSRSAALSSTTMRWPAGISTWPGGGAAPGRAAGCCATHSVAFRQAANARAATPASRFRPLLATAGDE